jgi:hypothetical protein
MNQRTAALVLAASLYSAACGSNDSGEPEAERCAEVEQTKDVVLEELRMRSEASTAAEATQRAAEGRGNFTVGSGDHQRALRAQFQKVEELAVLAEQNPSCFSVSDRAAIEATYRQWKANGFG